MSKFGDASINTSSTDSELIDMIAYII